MWADDNYRRNSPGEHLVEHFVTFIDPNQPGAIADFGAGTGRALKKACDLTGREGRAFDISELALDENVRQADNIKFEQVCLWEEGTPAKPLHAYGLCTDVMEHIPLVYVDLTLAAIASRVRELAYFQIFIGGEDKCGKKHGLRLHLTNKPAQWWDERLGAFFRTLHIQHDHQRMIYVGVPLG
jgi:hypothetical protein